MYVDDSDNLWKFKLLFRILSSITMSIQFSLLQWKLMQLLGPDAKLLIYVTFINFMTWKCGHFSLPSKSKPLYILQRIVSKHFLLKFKWTSWIFPSVFEWFENYFLRYSIDLITTEGNIFQRISIISLRNIFRRTEKVKKINLHFFASSFCGISWILQRAFSYSSWTNVSFGYK